MEENNIKVYQIIDSYDIFHIYNKIIIKNDNIITLDGDVLFGASKHMIEPLIGTKYVKELEVYKANDIVYINTGHSVEASKIIHIDYFKETVKLKDLGSSLIPYTMKLYNFYRTEFINKDSIYFYINDDGKVEKTYIEADKKKYNIRLKLGLVFNSFEEAECFRKLKLGDN